MSNRKRDYKYCQHCEKELNVKRFKEHQRLYYDKNTNKWIKEGVTGAAEGCDADVSDPESDFSYFDGNEGLAVIEDNEDHEIDKISLTDEDDNGDESEYRSVHLVKHVEEEGKYYLTKPPP